MSYEEMREMAKEMKGIIEKHTSLAPVEIYGVLEGLKMIVSFAAEDTSWGKK